MAGNKTPWTWPRAIQKHRLTRLLALVLVLVTIGVWRILLPSSPPEETKTQQQPQTSLASKRTPQSPPESPRPAAEPPIRKPPVSTRRPSDATAPQERIALLATNDIHGAIFPETIHFQDDDHQPATLERGGMDAFSGIVQILRKEWGDRLIWLDAGDQFQGTYESNTEQGRSMVALFNDLGLAAAAIGNHEFDFGIQPLMQRMTEAKYPYLAANIHLKEPGKAPPFAASKLIQVGHIQVGILGLTTPETPTTTQPDHIEHLSFGSWNDDKESLVAQTKQQAQMLRAQGAHLVVLVGHLGIQCALGPTQKSLRVRSTVSDPSFCKDGSEISTLLSALPAGTIDAVIAGHTHRVVNRFVLEGGTRPVPVVQAGHHLQYANVIYMTYDLAKHTLVENATRIEGPIPVCHRVFTQSGDCQIPTRPPTQGMGKLVDSSFHNQPITSDPKIHQKINKIHERLDKTLHEVLGVAARPIEKEGPGESAMGNLVTDAMAWGAEKWLSQSAGQPVIALINTGGLRASIDMGPIEFGELYRVLPFDNTLCTADVSGQELTTWLRAVHNTGHHGLAFSGIRLIVKTNTSRRSPKRGPAEEETPSVHSVRSGGALDITLPDGRAIDQTATYRLAMADFLFEGGSALGSKLPKNIRQRKACPVGEAARIRNMVQDYIKTKMQTEGTINAAQHPLVDAAQPRLTHVRSL